ncbi:M48 family metallopeptidase [Rodentibacter sp. Ppn85]|uniref:M48 family metallopeptidase n=1 Tax=Rodentibacter sp. Ppn85 TaxID=1908525 RepID=UPI0009841058|nr:M48 family metallopeptidase [Rodentibacter sp. Ppn85]OOF62296.1 deoxyribonuclease HsdR [Rodentibacter sp. Ppn85]
MKKHIKSFVFASIAAFVLNACADSASINQQAASSYAQEMGRIRTQGAVDTNSKTAKRIHRVFNKMVPYANKENQTGQPFNWQITVIKSKELNAWAMPGGKMAFYTGLVETLKLNDDEIATVMGHEMAHALKEHGKAKANFGMATGIAAQLGHVALSTVVGSDLSGIAISLTKDFALDKPYSRSAETEADEVGLLLMAKSGFNPQSAPSLWDKMKKTSGGSKGALDALASTHPTDEYRQENLRRLLPEVMKLYEASKK